MYFRTLGKVQFWILMIYFLNSELYLFYTYEDLVYEGNEEIKSKDTEAIFVTTAN